MTQAARVDGPPDAEAVSQAACPGTSSTARWDEAAALRGEIHTAERLAEHAVEVAKTHGAPSLRVRPGPLRQRFLAARERIAEAYDVLSRSIQKRREPSPAEEWLLDNSHIVEDQIREVDEDLPHGYLVELPRLAQGTMRGFPRVYGLCLDYLRHTDGRVDVPTLTSYVLAYQSVWPLTIGELWAVPIMLRLGLVLAIGALASSEAAARDRERGGEWAARVIETGQAPHKISTVLKDLEQRDPPVTARLLVELLRHLREHEVPLGGAFEWVEAQCLKMSTTPDELARREHLQQAADQVSVGNAITSMRAISALDWNAFFERTSTAEGVLRRDPAGAYAAMDLPTRDSYRHVVEKLARRGRLDETAVAERALALSERAARDKAKWPERAHVGYWLVGGGRKRLERAVGYRRRLDEVLVHPVLAHPAFFYLGAILLFTVAACVLAAMAGASLVPTPVLVLLLVLFAVPASEMAVAVVNSVVVAVVPPRVLPKMSCTKGIPEDARTLVVVPALLDRPETVRELLEGLEIRSLANLDPNLHFGLLTDFTDADTETVAEDAELLELARDGIASLNERWEGKGEHRYVLLHRRRRRSESQRRWMGWERKRGKLVELNRLLRGAKDTTFDVVTAPESLLEGVRYVITLDADTDLPRDVARKLVGTLEHPLNRPRVQRGRVARGHGIIQPRVGPLPVSSRRTRYARIISPPSGIDPYTTAVSDVYQDLFGEGSFVGKGIYDVDAFSKVMRDRVPEGTLLSHDLFEGIFARSALASDIEVLDAQPRSYEVDATRKHRWIRGDWQMLPWLLRIRGLHALDAWKIADNLRRSVLAPCLIVSCFIGWLVHPLVALWVTGTLAVMFLVPVLTRAVISATRAQTSKDFATAVSDDVIDTARQSLVHMVFLLDEALLAGDAITRTLWRLALSRRNLLEWTTMGQAERERPRRVHPRLAFGSVLSVAMAVIVALRAPLSLPIASPLLLWVASPLVARWLRRTEVREAPELRPEDKKLLRMIARRTWRFFDTFVDANDHHLPPDNYQEDPRGVIAHRTSPTNIGLYLLSAVAARDFGYITLRELAARLDRTLGTMERLERRDGHILNWYDTTTLKPLEPHYVSTVDSGNLAAYLWTLRQTCEELAEAPVFDGRVFEAADDALALASLVGQSPEIDKLRVALASMKGKLRGDLASDAKLLAEAVEQAAALRDPPWVSKHPVDLRYWLDRAHATLAYVLAEVREIVPFLETASKETRGARSLATIARLVDVADAPAEVRAAAQHAAARRAELLALGERAGALADAMSFTYLFDDDRKLFAIGYNATSARLDSSYYDLLASEARVASLVAIAKGDVPQEHWFRMARPRAATSHGARVLLSWSGSMFEYLMPLLVNKTFEGTLLDETYTSAVARQIEYGSERGVPWGVSESAFNIMDLAMTYQYRAFGVPGLGLKAGLGEDLVIAPYATALAALVDPCKAASNFRALEKHKALGTYGFYDAVDCTRTHLPPGRASVVVKTYMAHHQGMTLVALDNALNDAPMQRRFHRDPRVRACELLLEERIPTRAPLAQVHASKLRAPVLSEPELDVVEHVGLGARPLSRLHLLGHGELSTAITVLGEGFTTWKDVDVHRFREDACTGAGGIYVYLRDKTDGRVWSAGLSPTHAEPDFYDVAFAIDHVEISRRDGDIETLMEVAVSPEHPAEVRRITLTNHGKQPRNIELTTATEVVLAPRAADVAHRAFASMFLETEAVPERCAVLTRRRPRSPSEGESWVVQVIWPDGGEWSDTTEHETSRVRFIGRGRTAANPVALEGPLSGTTGIVLDPLVALRRSVHLEPGAHARITLTTALGSSRAHALELVDMYATPHIIPRAFELAWADARVELKHLGVSAAQSHRFQRLLSTVLFPQHGMRGTPDRRALHGRGRSGLWTHGLTSDLPIVVVHVDNPDFAGLFSEIILAHEFWRLNGVTIDLVALNDEPPGYMQPQQEMLLSLVRSSPAAHQLDQRGGVFLRRTRDMTEEERALLLADARVVLHASRGSLARQLRRVSADVGTYPPPLTPEARPVPSVAVRAPRPEATFDNGLGGFTEGGSTYTMTLRRDALPPMPWCNVIANPHFGTLVSEGGSMFTWYANSQRHRLSPWSNDPVVDPSGEVLYVRDDEDGSVFSLTPLPAGGDATYVVQHGQGWSSFEHGRGDLHCELVVFVHPSDAVKTCRVRIANRSKRTRQLSVYAIVEWVLGATRERSRASVMTDWDTAVTALFAMNPLSLYPERHAFLTMTGGAITSFSGDREEIFGTGGSRERPAAMDRTALSGRVGHGLDPCGALHVQLRIDPEETVDLAFLMGEGDNIDVARSLVRKHRDLGACDAALAQTKDMWARLLGAVHLESPDPALDALFNHWLVYQVTSCRLWGRTAFYQSGGAFGFRDQIQDVLALLHTRPDLAREHLLRAAGRQFLEGDVQHWWHAGTGEGVRTRCSDDMLWLPYAVAEYVRVTADHGILDERVSFLKERALTDKDEDIFSIPAITSEKGTIYEHCTRALDVAATSGEHGLPKMGSGDWNDGMNRVGRAGKGESVWLAWFLAETARSFSETARLVGDADREASCKKLIDRLREAVPHAWDGAWYRRAFFDDGTPLGTHDAPECRIDAIAQSWAVIAGIGDPERARQAVDASERSLVRPDQSLMRLLWPAFDKAEPDPGYIRAYPTGLRENGGQYTHGVLWTVQALAMLGEGDRAMKLLSMLNPIHHARTPEEVARYQVEPYVAAADVYDAPGHVGRGGWTWYTGSASVMVRVILEHILGIARRGVELVVDPCVARTWKSFVVTYRDGEGTIRIAVENPDGVQRGVRRVELDGKPLPGNRIPLTGVRGVRQARVLLGA